MSDSYKIEGVKITPLGGGFYELAHSSLQEPIKERGKEVAEQRAREIATAKPQAGEKDGIMPNQISDINTNSPNMKAAIDEHTAAVGNTPPPSGEGGIMAEQISDINTSGPSVQEAINQHVAQVETNAQLKDKKEPSKDDQIAELKAGFAEKEAALDEKMAALMSVLEELKTAGIRTVVTDPDATGPEVPNGMPRSFKGEMNAETKALMKKMGMKTVKIILEENSDIPPTGLYLGHNYRGYMIAPGEPVDVPEFLVNVLNDAITATPVVDSTSQKVLGYRSRMKYPYREVK